MPSTNRSARRLLAIAAASGLAVLGGADAAAAASVHADFNGDGRDDLAVGAPLDSVSGHDHAGALNVIYGTARGLREDPDQEFTQDSPGVRAFAEANDHFAGAVASGDFDGDGHDDLAIGTPGEDVAGVPNAGVVQVLYGSRAGLTTAGDDLFGQGLGLLGTREAEQNFGAALAVGDFDGDGHDDLAIGVPDDSVEGRVAAGAVNVVYGSRSGLTTRGNQLFTQASPGIKGIPATFARFGFSLAAGDVSRNGRDELAVGIPGGRIASAASAGAVAVLYGRRSGLSSVNQLWSQGAAGIKGGPEEGDNFGRAVAIGDFDGDGAGDLAVGVPFEDIGTTVDAGAVNVLRGSGAGLHPGGDQFWSRRTPGIKGTAAPQDRFGTEVGAIDLDGDGREDLVAAAPLDDVDGQADAGAVNVIYGSPGGLREDPDQLWQQNSRGIKGVAEPFDTFGGALGGGDFDGDRHGDLAVGVPRESLGRFDAGGAVNVLYGSGRGLRGRDQLWHQGSRGIKGAMGNDRFGSAIAGP